MACVYRVHYTETTQEPMPERCDLCVMARNKTHAKEIAQKMMGNAFRVMQVKRTYQPSNVLNLKSGVNS
jgi:hypothetical protein